MSGWWDDWADGKVDALTAFSAWLDGDKSPSQQADDKCGYPRIENRECRNETEREAIRRLYP